MNAHEYNVSKRHELAALRRLGWWPFQHDPATNAQEVAEWQAAHGLEPDGKLGPASWAKLRELHAPAGWLRRLPRGRAEVVATFGGEPDAPGWERVNLQRVLLPGRSVSQRVHRLIAPEFPVLLALASELSGYTPVVVQVYNLRRKRGGKPDPDRARDWSTHAWAIAVDIDPVRNPWGNKPSSPLIVHPEFLAVFRVAGWSIGADWDPADTMHVQACKGF